METIGWREGEYQQISKLQKENPYLSNTFKLWIMVFIFLLIFLHLYALIVYPVHKLISTEFILSLVLALVGYIWIQEIKDRHRLLQLNEALIKAQVHLERAEIDTIAALILIEEAKDPYVRGHSKRVSEFCLKIAREMGFSEERQKIIERAGILHDIGKLGIADSILQKPGKLDDEEWEIMKKHPRHAVEILEPLKFLVEEKKIVTHHHERYDGNGYPDGLKGEEIPMEARIMAVADTFDAMNSARAYRKALSRDAILSELKRVSGIQLDTSVVDVFLKLLKEDPGLWEKD